MDCNSYSYAPNMLEDSKPYIDEYENDDMQCTLEKTSGYTVCANSYDGTLDVCESYKTLDAARFLFSAIVDNFSYTAPTKKETRALINQAKRIDKKGMKKNVA